MKSKDIQFLYNNLQNSINRLDDCSCELSIMKNSIKEWIGNGPKESIDNEIYQIIKCLDNEVDKLFKMKSKVLTLEEKLKDREKKEEVKI